MATETTTVEALTARVKELEVELEEGRKAGKHGGIFNQKQCVICMEGIYTKPHCFIIECNHLFHDDCFVRWSTYRSTCPICGETGPQLRESQS
jgi:hypothetical protein